ncbi:UNVERIFIED_CONTAM: Golgin sub A member 2 [Siphonaria sp. JEL0065]|nr:Golgin sub A member 2 [Siphonaria sp. JEL0065]
MEEGIGLGMCLTLLVACIETKTEASNRLLKAKLVVVQEEMEKVVKNQGIKDTAISMLEEKLKFFDEERGKIVKNVQTLQAQIEKANRANMDLKARNEILETERASLKKELDGLNKERRVTENDVNSKDLRLNRALEEVDKLKQTLNKANADSKDKIETLKKNSQSLFAENKKLAKQKAELLSVFKKQSLLIDNLKRQKLHLEAAALLDFSEEEFVRALNCRPMAGKDHREISKRAAEAAGEAEKKRIMMESSVFVHNQLSILMDIQRLLTQNYEFVQTGLRTNPLIVQNLYQPMLQFLPSLTTGIDSHLGTETRTGCWTSGEAARRDPTRRRPVWSKER